MGAFMQELFRVSLYKRTQGRVARQATFAALAVIIAMGAWALSDYMGGWVSQHSEWSSAKRGIIQYVIPLFVLVAGLWASFRIVQLPNFADFLISVEGEMNKVTWPSRSELFRAALVVILVIFFLAAVLFLYDFLLNEALQFIERVVTWIFG